MPNLKMPQSIAETARLARIQQTVDEFDTMWREFNISRDEAYNSLYPEPEPYVVDWDALRAAILGTEY